MNDIRPPAQLLTGVPSTSGAGNGTRTQEDPAAAFDAVMARYSAQPSQPQPAAANRAESRSDSRSENRNDNRNERAESRERSSGERKAGPTREAPAQPARTQRGENKRNESNDAAAAGAPNAKPNTSGASDDTAQVADAAAGEATAAAQSVAPIAQSATPMSLPAELIAALGASAQAAEGGAAAVPAETLVAADGEAAVDTSAVETALSTQAQAGDGKKPAAGAHNSALDAVQSRMPGLPADDAAAAADKTSKAAGDKSAAVLAAQFGGHAKTAGAARTEQAAAAAVAGAVEATITAPTVPGATSPLTAQPMATVAPVPTAPTFSIAHAHIGTPVAQPGFAQDFGDRVVLFVNQRVQHAELSLTPAELGPVNVTIEVRGQEASLSFAAASGTSRAAIEDALPRLREMLAGAGLQLANAHVGDQPRREFGRGYRPGGTPALQHDGIQIVGTSAGGTRPRGSHLIDVIA